MEQTIGALWLKTSKAGNAFMSGVVEIDGKKYQIVVFKNNYKDAENKPDYKIYPSKPREQDEVFQDSAPF